MMLVPHVVADASPCWLTDITRGLLEGQVPLEPWKPALSKGCWLSTLLDPIGVNWTTAAVDMVLTLVTAGKIPIVSSGSSRFCNQPDFSVRVRVLTVASAILRFDDACHIRRIFLRGIAAREPWR